MWEDLSMLDRYKYISLAVQQGLTDLPTIKNLYNEYSEGGDLDKQESIARIERAQEYQRRQDSISSKKVGIPVQENPAFYMNEEAQMKLEKQREAAKQRIRLTDKQKRRIYSGMSALGYGISLIPHPITRGIGFAMQLPDLAQDIKDTQDETEDTNIRDVALDLLPDAHMYVNTAKPLMVHGFDLSKPVLRKIILPFGLVDAIGDAKYALYGEEEQTAYIEPSYILPEVTVYPE